jgi:cytochrome c oxidase subunit 3
MSQLPEPQAMTDLKSHHVPAGARTVGMWLFLAALTMLFAGTLLAYLIVRTRSPASPPLHAIRLPRELWLSTFFILLSSVTVQAAVNAVRRERQAELRRHLTVTCIFAALFLVFQTPAMIKMLLEHHRLHPQGVQLFGLIFFMVLIHALHVIGGVVALAITTYKAHRGAYDHEHYGGVRYTAMYWHFLDVVWIVMYGILLVLG